MERGDVKPYDIVGFKPDDISGSPAQVPGSELFYKEV